MPRKRKAGGYRVYSISVPESVAHGLDEYERRYPGKRSEFIVHLLELGLKEQGIVDPLKVRRAAIEASRAVLVAESQEQIRRLDTSLETISEMERQREADVETIDEKRSDLLKVMRNRIDFFTKPDGYSYFVSWSSGTVWEKEISACSFATSKEAWTWFGKQLQQEGAL